MTHTLAEDNEKSPFCQIVTGVVCLDKARAPSRGTLSLCGKIALNMLMWSSRERASSAPGSEYSWTVSVTSFAVRASEAVFATAAVAWAKERLTVGLLALRAADKSACDCSTFHSGVTQHHKALKSLIASQLNSAVAPQHVRTS